MAALFSFNIILSHSLYEDIPIMENSFHKTGAVTFLFILIILLIWTKNFLLYLSKSKYRIISQLYYLFVILLVPFVSLFLIENAYSIYDISHLTSFDYCANIMILCIIWLCLSFLTTSLRIGSIVLISLSLIVGVVTKILLITRNMPLLSYHFLQIQDGLSVADKTNFTFSNNISSLLVLSWILIITIVYLPSFDKLNHFKKNFILGDTFLFNQKENTLFFKKYFRKLIIFSLGIITTIFIAPTTIFSIAKSADLSLYFWEMQDTYYNHGLPVALTRYHLASRITKPKNYSSSKVESILKKYPKKTASSTIKPNIIIIQNESLTDYSDLTNLKFNQDPLAYIHSLSENTIKDKLDVSVFGGGTANTEYEALTSNSLAILPQNTFPFQQLISSPRNSIVNVLDGDGYLSVAVHPHRKNNYNRNKVYDYLGFDKSYFIDSKQSITDLIENPEYVRGYVSDSSLYKGALKLIANNKKPVFNFIVTMQGHEGYGDPTTNFPRTVSVENASNTDEAIDYLSSVKASDAAFRELTTKLSQAKEPTIVIMYGDHQPILSDNYFKSYFISNDRSSKYQTPLIYWANFDLPQTESTTISPNYIVPKLFSLLSETDYGLSITSYYQFLNKVQSEIPVMTTWGYYDSAGNYSSKTPNSDLFKQYQLIQYNNVIDTSTINLKKYYQ